MSSAIAYLIVAALLPVAAGYAFVIARRAPDWWSAHRPPAPVARPVEQLHADLRRLHDLLDDTENAPNLPAKNSRCQATRAAYVDALAAACRQLEVPPPAGRPVPRTEIYRVEADLRRLGLDVRPIA